MGKKAITVECSDDEEHVEEENFFRWEDISRKRRMAFLMLFPGFPSWLGMKSRKLSISNVLPCVARYVVEVRILWGM